LTARLRRARLEDLAAIVAIKEALRLAPGQRPERGGFLLGCSPDRYAQLIQCANVLLVEDAGEVAGFAVTLPDPLLKASDLWERRALIRWGKGEGEPPPGDRVAYFDQLALRPGARRAHAPALALAAVRDLAQAGHDHLYATTLDEPVRNGAALPLLRAVGARCVGFVEEHYPEVGRVVSRLHYVALPQAMAAVERSEAGRRTAKAAARLAA
jgi:hypothetical protein